MRAALRCRARLLLCVRRCRPLFLGAFTRKDTLAERRLRLHIRLLLLLKESAKGDNTHDECHADHAHPIETARRRVGGRCLGRLLLGICQLLLQRRILLCEIEPLCHIRTRLPLDRRAAIHLCSGGTHGIPFCRICTRGSIRTLCRVACLWRTRRCL